MIYVSICCFILKNWQFCRKSCKILFTFEYFCNKSLILSLNIWNLFFWIEYCFLIFFCIFNVALNFFFDLLIIIRSCFVWIYCDKILFLILYNYFFYLKYLFCRFFCLIYIVCQICIVLTILIILFVVNLITLSL